MEALYLQLQELSLEKTVTSPRLINISHKREVLDLAQRDSQWLLSFCFPIEKGGAATAAS
ncbi:hypothetical protein [Paraflavitalea speifideaquila]|uniref:hypothetical protein n=1 Tax=Paraflavitalea speifideaquila TaxID=3076558 RepID=UPI0028E8D4ED|nr:hypothetical protein [Paraflavitalea speifideiaquila]